MSKLKRMIQEDFKNSQLFKEDINKDISQWRDIYDGKPYGNEIEGRSQIVWKLVQKHGKILVANLAKPLLTGSSVIRIEPRTANDVVKAKLDQKLLDFFFNKRFDKVKFIRTLLNVMVKEGTAIVKVSWEKNKYFNRPYSDVVYNEDIFTQPNAISIKDSDYIIHRFETTFDELESDAKYNQEAIRRFKSVFDKDELTTIEDIAVGDDIHNRKFYLEDNDYRKKIFVYEYWYKSKDGIKIISFLNKGEEVEIIAEEDFEYDWFPFVEFPLYDNEFSIWGESLASIIEDEQKFMTSIVRGVIDNMALSNNGQKFIRKGALDSVNFKRLMEGKPVVEVNATEALQNVVVDGSFNELPSAVYNLLQVIETQAEGLTGVSKMMQGLQDVNNSSATASQIVMSQSQIRLLDIENNISNGLREMFSMWVEMINDYIDEKTMYQITGTTIKEEKAKLTEKLKKEFQVDQMPDDVKVKAMQIIANEVEEVFNKKTTKYDIDISIATDGAKQVKINQINMLMQQSAPLVQAGAIPPDIIRKLSAKLFELFDYPDLAKETEEYQPQPDPMQQQMMQLEMAEKQAKAKKEEALAQNALARTQQTMVKAQKEKIFTEPELINKYAEANQKNANAKKVLMDGGKK